MFLCRPNSFQGFKSSQRKNGEKKNRENRSSNPRSLKEKRVEFYVIPSSYDQNQTKKKKRRKEINRIRRSHLNRYPNRAAGIRSQNFLQLQTNRILPKKTDFRNSNPNTKNNKTLELTRTSEKTANRNEIRKRRPENAAIVEKISIRD